MAKKIEWGNIPMKGTELSLKQIAQIEGGKLNGKINADTGHCKKIAKLGGEARKKLGGYEEIAKLGGAKTAQLYSKPIEAFCKITGELKLEFTSAKVAGKNGFDGKKVRECLKQKRKTHLGYIWKYKN
jgi:general stress protein YciG